MPQFAPAVSVQSPKAYDLNNLTAALLGARMAAGASATLRGNWRTVLSDAGYQYAITPAETAAGLVVANLTLGFPPGHVARYGGVGDDATDDSTAVNRAKLQEAQSGGARVFGDVGRTYRHGTNAYRNFAGAKQALSAPHVNFAALLADFTVTRCDGPMGAALQEDIEDVFLTKYTAILHTTTKYIAPAELGGSDANTGDGWSSPYLTIDAALRGAACGDIYVWPGTYEIPSHRYTDADGAFAKRIIAPFGGVTVTAAGDDLSDATWALDATYGATWVTTLATANYVVRLRMAGLKDSNGRDLCLPYFNSPADVQNSGFGWYYDSATKKLYVRVGGIYAGTNVDGVLKYRLRPVYASGGDNRLLIYSAKSYWENITFECRVSIFKEPAQAVPEGWFKNCEFGYGAGNSIQIDSGGRYTQNCKFYNSTADHNNYNTTATTVPYGLEIGDHRTLAGDPDTYGRGATQATNPISTAANKNGSSAHEGYVIRINCFDDRHYGPMFADVSTSYTWSLGCIARQSFGVGTQKCGAGMQGNNAWIEGCDFGHGNTGIVSDSAGCVVRVTNSAGALAATNTGILATRVQK